MESKKNKIINHLTQNGKKQTSEKILLKSFKELQKSSQKQSRRLIELALIFSTPIFKLHKIKYKKRKFIKEIPSVIIYEKVKISLAIKFILNTSNSEKSIYFYTEFKKEIIQHAKNNGSAIQKKNELQKQVLLQRQMLSYYR